jgi:ankyrin repeat protein
MSAAARASRGVVQALLDKGADPSAKNKEGKTVLKWASGRPEIEKMIQEAAALKKKNPNGNVNGNANGQGDGR